MRITKVHLQNFKQFENVTIDVKEGLTLCAGPNNSGKSTLLHALAVWGFGVLVLEQLKGKDALLAGVRKKGIGLSYNDFTPLNLPDLEHLWHNRDFRGEGRSGYSVKIGVDWVPDDEGNTQHLTIALSLVQGQLYFKPEGSTLNGVQRIPHVVYVPPVAGVVAAEEPATPAKRRAMLGRGLAGSVLRNYLHELNQENDKARPPQVKGKGRKSQSRDQDQSAFEASDPWVRLNKFANDLFNFTLKVEPFDPAFHSSFRVNTVRKHDGERDLMVEGAGAQQWLTVLTFALDKGTDVLLLDEPDAHLFTNLKLAMLETLTEIGKERPQILLATHAPEVIKRHPVDHILSFRKRPPRYLTEEAQRVALLADLGDTHIPFIHNLMGSHALLFLEGPTDERILRSLAEKCDLVWPANLAVKLGSEQHSARLKKFLEYASLIPGIRGLSIEDRDEPAKDEIDAGTLIPKGLADKKNRGFTMLTWFRREIENYALVPRAIAEVMGEAEAKDFWCKTLGFDWSYEPHADLPAIMTSDVKKAFEALPNRKGVAEQVFQKLKVDEIHPHLRLVLKEICSLGQKG